MRSPGSQALWAKRLIRAQEAVDRLLGCRFGWYWQDDEGKERAQMQWIVQQDIEQAHEMEPEDSSSSGVPVFDDAGSTGGAGKAAASGNNGKDNSTFRDGSACTPMDLSQKVALVGGPIFEPTIQGPIPTYATEEPKFMPAI
ncbi:MAG: hypothetical protein Q9163_003979 [Psora crenata]